ncbi:MAG: vWA domain-containing protein [Acidobacteriota bacterium]
MARDRILLPAQLAAVLAASAAAQTVEMRRLDIKDLPVVRLDVRVTDGRGQDQAGLIARDFDLRWDGEPVAQMAIESPIGTGSGTVRPAPVFLLMDRSGDLSARDTHAVRKAAGLAAESLPSGSPIAVYSFDQRVREELPLEENREKVSTAITNVPPGQGTSYLGSLTVVAEKATAADPSRSAIIFIVSAIHYPGTPPPPGKAYSLKGFTIPIYPLVITEDRAIDEAVGQVVRRIAQGLPGLYRITFQAPRGADGEIHTVSLSLGSGGTAARARLRAMKGSAISPSPLLAAEVRRGWLVPWAGALVGSLFGGLVILIAGARGAEPRAVKLTPIVRLCIVGILAVVGSAVALLSFSTL